MGDNPFRNLPAVNDVLAAPALRALAERHAHDRIVAAVRDELAELRLTIGQGEARRPGRTPRPSPPAPPSALEREHAAQTAPRHQRHRHRPAHQPRPRPDGGRGGPRRLRGRPRLSQPGTGPGNRQTLVAAGRRARLGLPADRRGVGHRRQQLRRRDGDRAAGVVPGQGGDRLARPADRDRRQFPHSRNHGRQRRRAPRGRHDQHHPPGRLRTRHRPEHRRPDAGPHQQLPRYPASRSRFPWPTWSRWARSTACR